MRKIFPNPLIFRRLLASAATTKKKPTGDKKALPQKKVLMSKRKSASSSVSGGTARQRSAQTSDRTAALTSALFTVDQDRRDAHAAALKDPEQSRARATIRTAWRLHCEEILQEQRSWETAFMASKVEAMRNLRAISETWWRRACEVDYSLPPLDRRMATLTPPTTADGLFPKN